MRSTVATLKADLDKASTVLVYQKDRLSAIREIFNNCVRMDVFAPDTSAKSFMRLNEHGSQNFHAKVKGTYGDLSYTAICDFVKRSARGEVPTEATPAKAVGVCALEDTPAVKARAGSVKRRV